MQGRKAPTVALNEPERQGLVQLIKGHGTPQQVVLRARIVLAAGEGQSNALIAAAEGVAINTVRLWRARWLLLQPIPWSDLSIAERLADAPRPGNPGRISDEQVCQMVAVACELPAESGRPISQWTGRELADEMRKRGIIEQISPRHAARLLKRGICSHTASVTG